MCFNHSISNPLQRAKRVGLKAQSLLRSVHSSSATMNWSKRVYLLTLKCLYFRGRRHHSWFLLMNQEFSIFLPGYGVFSLSQNHYVSLFSLDHTLILIQIAGVSVEKMQLRFDDLLERHYNNSSRLELDQVTLDVNMTIHLINTLFMKKSK